MPAVCILLFHLVRGIMEASGSQDKREFLTCALCLDIFKDPRQLPCTHTFCCKCLDRLITRLASPSLPCPMCREPTKVPAGGATAFKVNRYILPEDLVRAKNWTLCLTHNKVLEFYCNRCSDAICLYSKLTVHDGHSTTDIAKAAEKIRTDLSKDKLRLQSAVMVMMQNIETGSKDQQSLKDTRAGLEREIHVRHATVVAAAKTSRDEALVSLHSLGKEEEDRLSAETQGRHRDLDQLLQLQERVDGALSSQQHSEVLTVAREMRYGRGSCDAVSKLTSIKSRPVPPLFLSFCTAGDLLQSHVSSFIGSVSGEASASPPEVKVVEQFRCGEEADTEVFSLCIEDSGNVLVSYARRGSKKDAPSEMFSEKGNLVSTEESTGKVAWFYFTGDRHSRCTKQDAMLRTHTKSPRAVHFGVINTSSEKATVRKIVRASDDPKQFTRTVEFNIKVGPHRAIDMDASEQLLVVVEEAQPPRQHRKVLMYRNPGSDPLATYQPPVDGFNPSDVCFHQLGGHQVLLVADEGNSSVHVVSVRGDAFTFLHHLLVEHPLLVQPTAINRDSQGRVWLACRGGKLLTVTSGRGDD